MPADYTRSPRPKIIFGNLEKYCDEVSTPDRGDIVVMKLTKEPQHLGILISSKEIVHSYEKAGGVIKQEITPFFRKRIHSFYRLKPSVISIP